MDEIMKLKSQAYDHLAQIEAHQREIQVHQNALKDVNALIVELVAKNQVELTPPAPSE